MRASSFGGVALAGLAVALAFLPTPAPAQTNVLFILDGSGSMKKPAGRETRIAVAKKAMAQALAEVPKDVRLGLLMYGHRRAKDCTDVELVSPIGADDAATINSRIQAVDAKGETPIADALRQAQRSFAALKGQTNSIVLVTDGIEECKGDPCAAARELKASGFDTKVHVVGFTLSDRQRTLVQCIPDITGGRYFEAKDAGGLTRALGEVRQQTVQAPPPPAATALRQAPQDDNLLSAANGGRLLLAPNDKWAELSDGKPARQAVYAGEGVWSFKDGKPATFEAFEVLVPEVSQYNHKDIELLVGDDGPTGTFRSLGELTIQNVKMMNSPWQKFTFPPTTARFLKVALKTDWGGGYVAGYELKLTGKVDDAAAPAAKAAAPSGPDLLAPANGGALVLSPNPVWAELTSGKPPGSPPTYAGEGVWRFKDGKPASFDRLDVLVLGRDQYNLKEFEVFAGDEGPTGAFRSLGTFQTTNARLFETEGWQAFALPPTTARFVKVAFKSHMGGGYVAGKGLRLYGKVDEAAAAAVAPPRPPGSDLLAASSGGMLLAAPGDEWKKLNDGSGARVVMRRGQEGIWAFKDEKPAILSAVEVRTNGLEQYNLKDFEVLVSTEAPTGPYKSVGSFTVVNGVYAASPYQTFTLPPTPARYVKLIMKSDWGGGYIAGYGLRMVGTPQP